MIINNTRENAIVDAICLWMGYQLRIGREQLIHEASLRYPIADTITAFGTHIERVALEKLHPLFKSRKIDLVIYEKDLHEIDAGLSDIEEVFEFKLAKKDTSNINTEEPQRLFDDIIRLAYYNLWTGKNTYFLICGKYDEFKTYFVGQSNNVISYQSKFLIPPRYAAANTTDLYPQTDKWEEEGLYKDLFSFGVEESKIKQFTIQDDWSLNSFQKSYLIREGVANTFQFTESLTIKTTCLAITPAGEKNKTHAAGIWRIEGF